MEETEQMEIADAPQVTTGPTFRQRISKEFTTKMQEGYFSNFFTKWQILAILGLSVSLLSFFVNLYDWIAKLDTLQNCPQSADLEKRINTKVIIFAVFSSLIFLVGIFLTYWFGREGASPHRITSFTMVIGGAMGIVYAGTMKVKDFGVAFRTVASAIAVIVFAILSWLVSRHKVELQLTKIE